MKSFSPDNYMDRQFRLTSYNCWDFAREVWRDLTGQDLDIQVKDFAVQATRDVAHREVQSLRKLDSPENPCLVLMERNNSIPHIGVFRNNKVLHLNDRGAWNQTLDKACLGFTDVSYYR